MKRLVALILLSGTMAACATESRPVANSFDSQFGALNKDGWSVSGGGVQQAKKHTYDNDPNVRVLGGTNWNAFRFKTNMQIDDPKWQKEHGQAPPADTPATTVTPGSSQNPFMPGH